METGTAEVIHMVMAILTVTATPMVEAMFINVSAEVTGTTTRIPGMEQIIAITGALATNNVVLQGADAQIAAHQPF
jgi:butyrate kinase